MGIIVLLFTKQSVHIYVCTQWAHRTSILANSSDFVPLFLTLPPAVFPIGNLSC